MVLTATRASEVLRSLLDPHEIPRPFEVLEIALGHRKARTPQTQRIADKLRGSDDLLASTLKLDAGFRVSDENRARTSILLGQLLLGTLAERCFESTYKAALGTTELTLQDSRGSRNDTDYLVMNGSKRQVFRINIKFHGTLFRQAQDLVQLSSEDCFALATYKIKQGLDKHIQEALPYLFLVVSCPLKAADVGNDFPPEVMELMCMIHASRGFPGKRLIEERIVERLVDSPPQGLHERIANLKKTIAGAPWRVISARRADRLLRELLFERVYAVRVKGFAQRYRRAEVDMHLSLDRDMKPLQDFLEMMSTTGLNSLMVRLERGDL